ncbi:peptide ABC transporter ATP-binding protein [Dolosigranulum pigrum]|uniref:peptide cleavage/export ABC transporter n=1 Tax=Dolosigranulum pigrum TaxID=29394 RepID=UPI000DBF95AB|nr:peptide cleavage/export ABC transporter [Dolosigranulum pigrum]RAN52442.1 peptide ABC transporter ATP-binding protein [Dolosigranulum pigrum]RAN53011.1 peptide ABC transporter ATP-binding protein [Dolosigranulum pigrum]
MNTNFRVIYQQDNMDCGTACVQMILHHYNSEFSIHKLKDLTDKGKQGTSALGIKRCLESLNFDCLVIDADNAVWTDSAMTYPAIAHLNVHNGKHYVVVYGYQDNKLFIADPDDGKYNMSIETFSAVWSRTLFVPSPGRHYKPIKEKVQGLMSFVPKIIQYKKFVVFSIIASLLIMGLSIGSSYYFQGIIDSIIPANNISMLNIISFGLMISYVLRVIFGYIRNYLLFILGQKLSRDIILNYFKHVLKLPISFFESRQSGEIISRFLDAHTIIDALANTSLTLLLDSLMVIVVGTVLLLQHNVLFGVTLVTLPLYIGTIILFIIKLDKSNEEEMESAAVLNSSIIESLNGIETIKSYNSEKVIYQRVVGEFEDLMIKTLTTMTLDNMQGAIKTGTQLVGNALVLWLGAYYVMSGEMSIGALITYNALLVFFTEPLESVINLQVQIQKAQVASRRMNDILSIEVEGNISNDTVEIEEMGEADLKFDDVYFSYGLGELILRGITCEIKVGDKIALVGESGSGKSTLAKMLVRFYAPSMGNIYFGKHDINTIDVHILRHNIVYVPQDSFFLAGTIRDNLLFGLDYEPTQNQIEQACEVACIKSFIESLPLQYHTIVEEAGSNLSKGQKQRLAIVRALLTNSQVIIFDEATSGIDVFSEQRIMDNIIKMTERTIIFITHSLPAAKLCEKIMVMDQGDLVEEGIHEVLRYAGGTYQKLWEVIS